MGQITFEEYKEKIYKTFLDCSKGMEQHKLDKFFQQKEQQDMIIDNYNRHVESSSKGIKNPFDDDTGYVLSLLFE